MRANRLGAKGLMSMSRHRTIRRAIVSVAGLLALAVAQVPAASAQQRGYELVSPADDGLYDVELPWNGSLPGIPRASGGAQSTPDGRHAVFAVGSGGTLPGMVADGESRDWFVASRTDEGWQWKAPLGDRTGVGCHWQVPPRFNTISRDGTGLVLALDCARDKRLLSPPHPTTGEPLDQSGSDDQVIHTLYRATVATDTATFLGGKFGVAGPVPRTNGLLGDEYAGGSPDLSTVYFATGVGLVPGLSDSGGGEYLYRNSDGATTLVTRTASGSPFFLPVTLAGGWSLTSLNTVSVEGDAVTLTAPATRAMVSEDSNGVADVYQVRGSAVTWISWPTKSPPAVVPADRLFEGASADGDRVLFTTTEQMTADDADARKDVYAYDVGDEQLTRVSTGSLNDNADTAVDDADFSTLSDDGDRVFFVTGSQLAGVDSDAGASLYVRDLATAVTSYVAPVTSPSDSDLSTHGSLVSTVTDYGARPIKVSQDGGVAILSLATDVELPAGSGGPDSDGARDLFVWRAGVGLRRVRQGVGADDNTTTIADAECKGNNSFSNTKPRCRGMSNDGELVFFQTTDSLVAGDTDGGWLDVYALHTADGSVDLVSPPGDAPTVSRYADNSASGQDVFFTTAATLDPSRDLDGGRVDLYDARLGDVFPPLPPVVEIPCIGDACQPPASGAPSRPSPGSQAGVPVDNVAAGPRTRLSVALPGRRARERAARTGVLSLRVRATGSGRVSAVALARVSGARMRKVATDRVRVRGGRATVRLRLSRAARSRLRSGRALRVRVRVRMPGARGWSGSVALRLPAASRDAGAKRKVR